MKTLMVIFALLASTIGLSRAQTPEKFYVYEARVTKSNAIVYEKCYKSTITIKRTKDFIEIKTDSITFKEFTVKHENKVNKISNYTTITGFKTEIHVVRELNFEGKYYLMVQPILLTIHHHQLGGYGLKLIVSNQDDVWSQIDFTINNRE